LDLVRQARLRDIEAEVEKRLKAELEKRGIECDAALSAVRELVGGVGAEGDDVVVKADEPEPEAESVKVEEANLLANVLVNIERAASTLRSRVHGEFRRQTTQAVRTRCSGGTISERGNPTRRREMHQFKFIKCARTDKLYPINRIYRVEPLSVYDGAPFHALIEDGKDGFQIAFLYANQVEDLQTTYVPATPGQKVLQVNYDRDGGDDMFYFEVPVIAWQLNRGDVVPVGLEGKIDVIAENVLWLMVNVDGQYIWPHMGVYDSLEEALDEIKNEVRKRATERSRRQR
jgi:hypothetical protein